MGGESRYRVRIGGTRHETLQMLSEPIILAGGFNDAPAKEDAVSISGYVIDIPMVVGPETERCAETGACDNTEIVLGGLEKPHLRRPSLVESSRPQCSACCINFLFEVPRGVLVLIYPFF